MFGAILLNRRIRRAPRYTCASLPENVAGKLVGVVAPFERELIAPFSGRRCVYYRLELRQYSASREDVFQHELGDEQRAVPFLLVDDSGHAVIDPRAGEIAIARDQTLTTGDFNALTTAQLSLLAKYAVSVRRIDLRVSFREAALEVGSPVAVFGAGTREPDPDAQTAGTYREELATRLRMMHSAGVPLRITDDPKTAAAG